MRTGTRVKTKKAKKCTYLKGGVCKEHGEGARLKWKPVTTWEAGPDGRRVKNVTRKYEYVCDLDMVDGRKLEQRRLSFAADTLMHVAGNTNKGHLGTLRTDASTGAKNSASTAQNGGNVIDEK